jgi:hypothetical protein
LSGAGRHRVVDLSNGVRRQDKDGHDAPRRQKLRRPRGFVEAVITMTPAVQTGYRAIASIAAHRVTAAERSGTGPTTPSTDP